MNLVNQQIFILLRSKCLSFDLDIDECTNGTHKCDEDASCSNDVPGYTCTCNKGYNGDGFNCTDIDECAEGSDECDDNAECDNTPGTYQCLCNEGYRKNATTQICEGNLTELNDYLTHLD